MKKLGFGMFRMPLSDPKEHSSIDMTELCAMVDAFLERGYTYFDTAYLYHGGQSEIAAREVLVKRYPRDSFMLADKMPVFHIKPEDGPEKQAKIFDEQREKCGVDYFDYYLLHALNATSYKTAQRLDTFAFLSQKKAEGYIRHLGFSFHDKVEVLDHILNEHPEMEFVQLQINYLDWENERIQSRKCYETARRHGKDVVIMEPVKGGRLADLPDEAAAILKDVHPDWSPASWAIRFAADLEGVIMVLSGMSNLAQVDDNTSYMHKETVLSNVEHEALKRVLEILYETPAIGCTSCRYCMDYCPQSIKIPEYFALFNADETSRRQGVMVAYEAYRNLSEGVGKIYDCVGCCKCEQICPQHLPITKWLENVKKRYEGGLPENQG